MKVDTKKIILLARKYSLLVLIVLISIAIGSLAYSVGIDVNNENKENNKMVLDNKLETVNGLSKITLDDIITKNKVILEKLEIKTEAIPYETIALGRSKEGTATTITDGKDGEKEITYKVRYEDDIETSRIEVSNEVTKEVVNKVVEYSGTTVSRSGETVDRESNSAEDLTAPVSGYTKVMDMKFTAYCLCKKCTGKSPGDRGYGVTASGYKITPGQNQKVIAVDPKVIPLGTKVYVQGVNGMSDYGYAIAADTGGAIKGNKIDIYVDQHGTTQWWTVGKAKVYIFE